MGMSNRFLSVLMILLIAVFALSGSVPWKGVDNLSTEMQLIGTANHEVEASLQFAKFEVVPGEYDVLSFHQRLQIDGLALSPHGTKNTVSMFVDWYNSENGLVGSDLIVTNEFRYPGTKDFLITVGVLVPDSAKFGMIRLQNKLTSDFTDDDEMGIVEWSAWGFTFHRLE